MNEIKINAERIRMWQRLYNKYGVDEHDEWCICVGLYETAGWIGEEDRHNILRWAKSGHKRYLENDRNRI